MDNLIRVVYAGKPETPVYPKPRRKSQSNSVLLGTWLGVTKENEDGWLYAVTAGPNGWVHESDTRPDSGLKIFFIDVGQGDGCLIETPGKRIIVDGGPNANMRNYLTRWQYSYVLKEGERVHIDAVFVSHFDADHYAGLTGIIADDRFEFGTIYHNGIARFQTRKSNRPAAYDTDLGQTDDPGPGAPPNFLLTTFSDIASAKRLLNGGGLQTAFRKFLAAVVEAKEAGRLATMKRLQIGDAVAGFTGPGGLTIETLGPVPKRHNGSVAYKWFDDSSHTRNGHSLVLKLHYGNRTVLLGGDLNTAAENHLLAHYEQRQSVFRVDVAKSCHHGSSDFTVQFMKALKPYATVISSGDNESYSHPRADAIGCAGRYARGKRPLVFSTELARSVRSSGDILYGMINLRTDGAKLVLAQMKESGKSADVWDSYELP